MDTTGYLSRIIGFLSTVAAQQHLSVLAKNPVICKDSPMNNKTKKRLIISTLAIVIIVVAMVAFAGAQGASRSVSLTQAVSGEFNEQRIQVEGTVLDDSFKTVGTTTTFLLYDPTIGSGTTLAVSYTGGLSATFGGGIVAICTGRLDDTGMLVATEMVTKCPSKYESAEGSITVSQLLRSQDSLANTEVRLAGYVKPGTLSGPGSGPRFVLYSQGEAILVMYTGVLPEGCVDDSALVLTGVLDTTGGKPVFIAQDVSLESVG